MTLKLPFNEIRPVERVLLVAVYYVALKPPFYIYRTSETIRGFLCLHCWIFKTLFLDKNFSICKESFPFAGRRWNLKNLSRGLNLQKPGLN